MTRIHLVAIAALAPVCVLSVPVTAQSVSQEELDQRYDRALAAGYKALMLCGAMASAERSGTARTPESVQEWELTGIYPSLDPIVRDLPYEIVRVPVYEKAPRLLPRLHHVRVSWADDMLPRVAVHRAGEGCSILPPGAEMPAVEAEDPVIPRPPEPLFRNVEAGADGVAARAFGSDYGEGTRTTAVLVRQNGGVIAERYREGFDARTPQRTWSVAKSIAATLVGAAVERGDAAMILDRDHAAVPMLIPVMRWYEGEDDPRQQITLDNLLRMASGRYSDTAGNRTDPVYWGGASVDERASSWPIIHQPGTVFRYANNDTLMAVEAISHTFADHPPAEFFARLGMFDTVAETDWQGNYVLSSQVWSTARDLADLGQLYLNDGMLNGERILPQGWLEYVSAPSGPQPPGAYGYGAGWWLMRGMDGIPDDTIAARGNRGQYVVVVPSRDIVIVRRGEDPAGKVFDLEQFTRDMLGSL
ncbi:serine hydrolase [Qipengyuania sp. JC766]|uniref:serine hydrolase domain-containing protein n=1 Tax=Qipengyuania sp. JC766 TaxID=3232139 RepID=UPI003457A455